MGLTKNCYRSYYDKNPCQQEERFHTPRAKQQKLLSQALHSTLRRWSIVDLTAYYDWKDKAASSRRTPKWLHELGDYDRAGSGKGFAVELDALDVVERVSGKITLSTVRATDHGDVLDHQKAFPLPMSLGHVEDASPRFSTNIAKDSAVMFPHTPTAGVTPALQSELHLRLGGSLALQGLR